MLPGKQVVYIYGIWIISENNSENTIGTDCQCPLLWRVHQVNPTWFGLKCGRSKHDFKLKFPMFLNVLPQIVAQINSSKTMPQGCCFQELVIKMDSGPNEVNSVTRSLFC